MALHSAQTTANGIHIVVKWSYANTTARDAASYTSADIGGVAQVGAAAPYDFYILTNDTGPAWVQVGAGSSTTMADDALWNAAGDIAYASADDTGAILAAGSNGEVLTLAAGVPSWAAAAAGGVGEPMAGTHLRDSIFHVDYRNDASWVADNGTTWTDLIGELTGTAAGYVPDDGHFRFNGNTSEVDFGAAPSDIATLFAGGGTIEVWVYPESDGEGNVGIIMDTGYGQSSVNWALSVKSEASGFVKLVFTHGFDGANDGVWSSTDAEVPIDTWSCLTVQYDSDSAANNPAMRMNGIAFAGGVTEDTTPAGSADTSTSPNIIVGNNNGGTACWDGRIEVITLWGVDDSDFDGTAYLDSFNAYAHRYGENKIRTATAYATASTAFGSSNTRIMRWTNRTSGTGLTFTDSSTNGTYVTVLYAGTYAASFNVDDQSTNDQYALNVAAALSNTYNGTHIRGHIDGNAMTGTVSGGASWVGHCDAGDLIWVSASGSNVPDASSTLNRFDVALIARD